MSLAALKALIAGVKVRCEVVERDRHRRQGLLAQRSRHRLQVGVGEDGVPAVLEGLRRRRERGPQGQARHVAGHLRSSLGLARIVTAHTVIHALGCGRDATAAGGIVICAIVCTGQGGTSEPAVPSWTSRNPSIRQSMSAWSKGML